MKQAHKHHLLSISFLANRAFSLELSSFNELNLDYKIRLVSRSYQTVLIASEWAALLTGLGVKCVLEQRHSWLPAAKGGCCYQPVCFTHLRAFRAFRAELVLRKEEEKRSPLQLQVCVMCVCVTVCGSQSTMPEGLLA